MLQRFAQYLFALTVLVTACAVYHSSFVTYVEPGTLPDIAMASSPVLRRDEELAALFAPGSWQRGDCKRLKTRDGVLLFEKWEQLSDDQWKLWPVAVVMGSKSNSPLIMEAIEGAEIKFTEALDVMSGGAPPIELGRMIGAVRIRNASPHEVTSNDKSKPSRRIEIDASEVGMDRQKIWTTQPIRVQLGDAILTGRDLTLHLSTIGVMIAPGENALSMLDRLELIYLDELTVPLSAGGLWGDTKLVKQAAAEPLTPRPIPIGREAPPLKALKPGMAAMRCGGRVVFQFATGELALETGVELRHQASLDSPQVDTFTCDSMKLRFTDLLSKRQRGDHIEDYLLSLVAVGRPAQATLPGLDARLAAGQIEFDSRAELIRMGGPAGVMVTYAGNRWQFNQVNYRLHPTDPKLLGTFDAIGRGSMDVAESLNVPVKTLQWSGGIKLERLETDDLLSLQVDGDVAAAMTDGGSFRCDAAKLVLQQIAAPNRERETSGAAQLIPKTFQATGREVRLETPVIAIATRLLQLYFEVAPNAPATGSVTSSSTAQADNSLRRWVKQPGSESANAKLAGNATPVVRSRPSVHGDTINAKLRLSSGNVTARDLAVVGNVALSNEIQTRGGPLPAVLTGDRLILSDGGGNDILQIDSGVDRPARFQLGDGFFIGPSIQVRMADNVVWIKDAGEFQLPSQVLPRIGSLTDTTAMIPIDAANDRRDSGRKSNLEVVSPPKCRWRGQMMFDGRTATLTDGVEIHTAIVNGAQRDVWDLLLVGEQLKVTLDQDVKIRDVDSVKSATVNQVSITGSAANPLLVTANQLTAAGLRKARHVLAAPQLTMKPATGQLSGPGPGWYRAWMQSNPMAQFAQPIDGQQPAEPSMSGVHLVYQESLNADLNDQSLDFIRNVRIAARRVATWDDLIDVAQMQGLRLGESTLDCDRLRLAVDGSQKFVPVTAAWEMEAIGNVAFQTRIEKGLFNGTAARASYSAAKDIFLIEGAPGRSAELYQTLPTGQAGGNLAVPRMAISPKTMELQNLELDRFQLGPLPGSR